MAGKAPASQRSSKRSAVHLQKHSASASAQRTHILQKTMVRAWATISSIKSILQSSHNWTACVAVLRYYFAYSIPSTFVARHSSHPTAVLTFSDYCVSTIEFGPEHPDVHCPKPRQCCKTCIEECEQQQQASEARRANMRHNMLY